MQEEDKTDFAKHLGAFFSLYKQELTKMVARQWWGALAPYPLEDVIRAMSMHATDAKVGMFPPTPAHVIKHITETLPDLRVAERVRLLRQQSDALAPIEERGYMNQTKYRLGQISKEEARAAARAIDADIAIVKHQYRQLLADFDREHHTHDPEKIEDSRVREGVRQLVESAKKGG